MFKQLLILIVLNLTLVNCFYLFKPNKHQTFGRCAVEDDQDL